MIKNKKLELYFHIPFCVKKCNYCDFLSAPCTPEQQEAYMGALFAELEGRADEYRDYEVTTIFIGGGTPSIVDAHFMEDMLEKVFSRYQVAKDAEISIEVNPGTVDADKLNRYKRAGINRLSIGLQSANEKELETLGRIHNFARFQDTYRLAWEAGFTNINVDVMSALPGQNKESYRETLHRVLTLTPAPKHISAYSLIVEEGTVFAEWEREGKLNLPDEDTEREMYEETKQILADAGYHRYEISNYARDGYECRHNCGYWKRENYVGFGIGAASMVENCRFTNGTDLQEYINEPLSVRTDFHRLTVEEQMEEFMFLGLRLTGGVGSRAFEETFGRTPEQVYGPVIEKQIEEGLLYLYEQDGERYLALTDRGLDLSNYVMSQFLFDSESLL